MNDEMSASSLICAAVDGLNRGKRVSLKLDGQAEWVAVEAITLAVDWPGLFECRYRSGSTIVMAPMSRLVAIEVGEASG